MKKAKYISNGTLTYIIEGQQGPQGPQGPVGPQGPKGENREIEFINENGVLKWRYKDETEFNTLLDASFINDSKPNYVTPEMYGAKGDGITDDKMAFMEALKQDLPIVLGDRKYLVSSLLLSDCIIDGLTRDSTLIVKDSLKCKSNIHLKNMIIEMSNDKTSESVIKTFKSS